MILLLAGCVGYFPFRNEPPVMLSFNGMALEIPFGETGGYFSIFDELLEEQPIVLAVRDPERDKVRVWFPYLTGTMEFDNDTLEGVWRPDFTSDNFYPQLEIILEDDKDPAGRSMWTFGWPADTG